MALLVKQRRALLSRALPGLLLAAGIGWLAWAAAEPGTSSLAQAGCDTAYPDF